MFARINRRRPGQLTLDLRPFSDDMRALAASHRTRYREDKRPNQPARTWFGADMELTPDDAFLTGTLGYSEQQEHRSFDTSHWSWIKGETRAADAGSEQTVVPFAIDLAEDARWVAFATAGRLHGNQCAAGLRHVLREGVLQAGLIPAEWDVDLVTSRSSVFEWMRAHPDVRFLRRTIKFTNPGLDLDGDRSEMRALGANRKAEEFAAPYSGTLDTGGPDFSRKLEGIETGDVTVSLEARGEGPGHVAKFTSTDQPDRELVVDFGNDLELGVEIVLGVLRGYSRRRHDPPAGDQTSGRLL